MLALMAVAMTGVGETADARPKGREAKAEFNRGVAAYQKGDFEAASAALGKSFGLERDVDTLFAWAQAERKLEHCDKAIDLYEKLLGFKLPAANKTAVEQKLTECRAIVAQQKAAEPGPAVSPSIESRTGPAPGEPQSSAAGQAAIAPAAAPLTDTSPATRAWYKDPISLSLIGTGAVATGIGVGFLLSARSADGGVAHAPNYDEAVHLADQAKSRGNIGLVATAVGGALLVGGVVWIATHRHATESRVLTGWLAPNSGGLAVAGAF
jgi:tetratricopeptide (TPR) repeat protein